MFIGVPKEIKNKEFRVGLTPSSVAQLCQRGHRVFIERGLGKEIGFTDILYINSGAQICDDVEDVYSNAELIIKVKEPLESEYRYLNEKHTLFTFLHLAGNPDHVSSLIETGSRGIAYETITDEHKRFPILAPMSLLAGQIAIVVGNYFLLKPNNGKGVIAENLSSLAPRVLTIFGAGVAGMAALDLALKQGYQVNLVDISQEKLSAAEKKYSTHLSTFKIDTANYKEILSSSDLIIGAVHVGGKKASKILSYDDLDLIQRGSVLVDISIDQGGCFTSSRPTTHDEPTFSIQDISHYCVTNMPGAVPLSASEALNNATMPYITELADGIKDAISKNKFINQAINYEKGKLLLEDIY
ncbi:MAG: alanine dehydrogenase [Gammaproteobacteria bacterium]